MPFLKEHQELDSVSNEIIRLCKLIHELQSHTIPTWQILQRIHTLQFRLQLYYEELADLQLPEWMRKQDI